jgi:hypothetical protein
MPDPSVNEGHYDQLLTNMSLAYMQGADNFIADKVFPVVPVAKASAFYWIYPRGYFFRDEVGPRPMGGYARKTGYKLQKGTYNAEEEALSADLDDRERANATPPNDPERSKIRLITTQHLIHRDKRWAAAYFKAGVWTTDLAGVAAAPGANQFLRWDVSTSTPIKEIKTRARAVGQLTGMTPNVLVLGSDVEIALENHPDIIDRIKYTERGMPTREILTSLFGVDRVVVPLGIQNTADEGQADVFSFIFNTKAALLVYAAPDASIDAASGGYIFGWTGLLGDNAFQTIAAAWRGRDERAHSDWFEVRMAYDLQVVAPDLGVFFAAAVS